MAKARRRKSGVKGRGASRIGALAQRLGLSGPSGSRRKSPGPSRRSARIVVVFALGLLAGAIGLHAVNDDEQ
ncbi:MAG: hypothetical protein WD711_10115, partial [Dongiaceae bacterium]